MSVKRTRKRKGHTEKEHNGREHEKNPKTTGTTKYEGMNKKNPRI